MDRIIKPIIIFLAIISTSPFLTGAGVITPGSQLSVSEKIAHPVIMLATFHFFIISFLKIYDFLKNNYHDKNN